MTTEEKLGNLVKYQRLCLGLTCEEVAKAIGANKGTISRWERGRISMSVANLISLCKALDITPAEILAQITAPEVRPNED